MTQPLTPPDALHAFVAELQRLQLLSDDEFADAYPQHLTPIVTTVQGHVQG